MATWLPLGVAAEATDLTIHAARAGDHDVVAVRVGDSWSVFADRCTHADCSFTDLGEIEDGVLICNCHGAEFDLTTGGVLQDPAEEPLVLLPVEVREGELFVLLG